MDEHDGKNGYCRRLGHHLPFKYCRLQDGSGLCPKIRDCWFETFDINAFLNAHYTQADLAKLDTPPVPRAVTLFELIERAKKAREADGDVR